MAGKKKEWKDSDSELRKLSGEIPLKSNVILPYGGFTMDFTPYQNKPYHKIEESLRSLIIDDINALKRPPTVHTSYRFTRFLYQWLDIKERQNKGFRCVSEFTPTIMDEYLRWLSVYVSERNGQRLSESSVASRYLSTTLLLTRAREKIGVHEPVSNKQIWSYMDKRTSLSETSVSDRPLEAPVFKNLINALGQEIQWIRQGKTTLDVREQLAVYYFLIAARTGLNSQPLLDLRRDSLRPHLFKKDKEILATKKFRSRKEINQPISKTQSKDGNSTVSYQVGNLVREVLESTSKLALEAAQNKVLDHEGEPLEDFLFLLPADPSGDKRSPKKIDKLSRLRNYSLERTIKRIIKKHSLKDSDGSVLKVSTKRLRKTMAESILEKTGGDMIATALALGNTPRVVDSNYSGVSEEMMRNFAFAGNAFVEKFTSTPTQSMVSELASALTINEENAERVLNGKNNTGVSRCSDPMHGTFAPKNNQEFCLNWTQCFKCPSQVIFKDDLHRLFSFYWLLIKEKEFLKESQWADVYGWIVREIDEKIAPRFKKKDVAEAKRLADVDPHPLWKTRANLIRGFENGL